MLRNAYRLLARGYDLLARIADDVRSAAKSRQSSVDGDASAAKSLHQIRAAITALKREVRDLTQEGSSRGGLMAKTWWLAAGLALAVAGCSGPKDVASVPRDAQSAMGTVTSIQYSDTGMNAFFGQALTSGEAWPRRDLSGYTRTINYEQRSSRDELNFAQPVDRRY